MKKQLGILLLALIATVGFSGAVAAAPPINQGPIHGPTIGHNIHSMWVVIWRGDWRNPYWRHFKGPNYRITFAHFNHRTIVTVWKKVYRRY